MARADDLNKRKKEDRNGWSPAWSDSADADVLELDEPLGDSSGDVPVSKKPSALRAARQAAYTAAEAASSPAACPCGDAPCQCTACCPEDTWDWRILPDGLIYKSYLAGVRESRFGSVWYHDPEVGWQWDIALGGRVGMLRYGTERDYDPEGWQVDIEGAAFPRLDLVDDRRDLVAADFRFGLPLTYGSGLYQMKLAYYHLSSHLGDEFIERTGAQRINFTRDALVWGHSYYLLPSLRVYGEIGYAFHVSGGSEPWEFQFGADYGPSEPTGIWGAPFAAVNVHLREEVDFGGNFVFQAGWAWLSETSNRLFRAGFHYYNGKSPQYEFFDQFEEQIGVGLWYDY